jgi:hypothetical protein
VIDERQSAVLSGVNFLCKSQLSYGEFQTLQSVNASMSEAKACWASSPYITTFILHSLSFIKGYSAVDNMIKKSVKFLQEEMEMPGVWRFYTRQNRKIVYVNGNFRKVDLGIVPDFDDTACVSNALKSNGVDFPDNRRLFYNNQTPEGIFFTWLLSDTSLIREKDYCPPYNNICCGVNANILLYLGDIQETSEAVNYINDVIANNKQVDESAYFPNPFVVYYLISRAYSSGLYSLEPSRKCIVKKIACYLLNEQQTFDTMTVILAVASLLNFNHFTAEFSKWVDWIVEAQSNDGSWPLASFFIDTNNHYGSKELTTSVALEVISKVALYEYSNPI